MVEKKRFVALGDSYTYCQGVDWATEWTKYLSEDKALNIEFVKSIAFNGWTAQELFNNCKKRDTLKIYKPDFCTLLIGVNDWFDGISVNVFLPLRIS